MLTPELIAALPDGIKTLNEEIEHLQRLLEEEHLPASLRAKLEPKHKNLITVRNALGAVHADHS